MSYQETVDTETVTDSQPSHKSSDHPVPGITVPKRRLYIRGIAPVWEEAQVKELFSYFGTVFSLNLLEKDTTDPGIRAYVVMDAHGAENAITSLREDPYHGAPQEYPDIVMSASYASEKPMTVFCKHLPETVERSHIHRVFSAYGAVKEVVMLKDNFHNFKCKVLVEFSNPDDAEKAIDGLDGKENVFNGQTGRLHVSAKTPNPYTNSARPRGPYNPPPQYQPYPRGAPYESNQYRQPPYHPGPMPTGYGRDYGGYSQPPPPIPEHDYRNPGGRAYDSYGGQNNYYYGGQQRAPYQDRGRQSPRGGRKQTFIPGCNICVQNLPAMVDDDHLRALFTDSGSVLSCLVFKDKVTGLSKGFGFVSYDCVEAAEKAISTMNGRIVMGTPLTVVKKKP